MVKSRRTLEVLISKGRTKRSNDYRYQISRLKVESWKLFRGKRKLGGRKKTGLTWKMDDMSEEGVVEVEFFQHLLQIKMFTYIPRFVPFDLGPWKLIIIWWYNLNSMCLSIWNLFTSQLLTQLKSIDMIIKQLQRSNASTGSKKRNYHVGWTIKGSLQLTLSCYISSGCGSFIS